MDQEGVYEAYYAECGSACEYGVRNAIRSLPFNARWLEGYFVGLHLPLTRKLPKRLDEEFQQDVSLHRYDAIVLAGVDPTVLDADDLLNLLAYVERGGGLLLMGGDNAFSNAQRGWGPLREALPAKILFDEDVELEDEVSLVEAHPVTRGVSGPFGIARIIHPIEPKDSATVIAAAGDRPVIVAATHGKGRVLIVGSYPEAEPSSMFASPGYADLIRQTMMWLMNRPDDLVIDGWHMDTSPLKLGEKRTVSVDLSVDASAPVEASANISRADPGWLSAGREPCFGSPRNVDAIVSGRRIECVVVGDDPGLYRVRIDVSGNGWANTRIADVEVKAKRDITLSLRGGRYVTAPGRAMALTLGAGSEKGCGIRVIDFDGREVLRKEDVAPGDVDLDLPRLETGHYEVVAESGDAEARLRFYVTEPLERIGFSIVGTPSTGNFTEEKTKEFYEYFRDRGFNAFASGLRTKPGEDYKEAGMAAGRYLEYLVQRDGFDLWAEYEGATLLKTHGMRGEEGTDVTDPCIFDPEHAVKLKELLEMKYRTAASIPRITSLEILDEPHFYRANVCHCKRCTSAFRDRYGHDMPMWDEALAARDNRTRNYFEWLMDYGAEAFRMGYETWKSLRGESGPGLHHVLCSMGNGNCSVNNCIAEDLPWTPHADFIEFDCYNYMYPHWRACEHIRFNEFHYMFSHFRFQALRNGQRYGFFIQVTDRDAPDAPWDPLRAPSETLYTAVGGGAKTFHLMAKGSFTNTQNCREEKFDTFAEDVKKVQRVAPLLDRSDSPRSRIAMIFPFHDRFYRYPEHHLPEGYIGLGFYGREHRPIDTLWPYHKVAVNVAELLFRAFGEVDVIDQRALHEGALDDYRGFVLTGTDYMADEDAEAVVKFVRNGGALICDHIPSHNTDGGGSGILQPLFVGEKEHFHGDVTVSRSSCGGGSALLFSEDLNELYTGSIEKYEPALRYRIKDTVRDFFFERGILPHALSSNYEVEASVLLTPDTVVLVCVNHSEERERSLVTLYSPTVPVTCAWDLVTMRPYPIVRTTEGIQLEADLGEREGLILGLYRSVPESIELSAGGDLRRGGRLTLDVRLTDGAGEPVRGDHIVEVAVTDPRGERRRPWSGLFCAQNGVLEMDRPLAVNAREGEWTITAFDRFTTQCVREIVTIGGV